MAAALPDDLGQHRHVRAAEPKTNAAAPSPPSRSSALPGSPVRMSASTTIVGTADPAAATSAPTPDRTAPTISTASASAGSRSAACTAVALVLSAYAGTAVAKNSCRTDSRPGCLPARPFVRPASAARPAATAIDVVSSSYAATDRVPRPPAAAQDRPDPAAFQLVVRDVGAVADQASHGTPHELAR